MAVTLERVDRVAIVTIDRPDRANAIDLETAQQLSQAFDLLADDDAVRAVVLTGAGSRVFSAGMDLKAVQAGQAGDINGVPGGFAGIVRRDFPKPLIAAVNGAAFGGGFEIVLACDLVVAAANARFGLPEVTLGLLAASGGAVRLGVRVPAAVAFELLLTGDPLDAERALSLGLVNQVVPEGAAREEALALATRVAAHAPLAAQAGKRIVRRALTEGEQAAWQLNDELAPVVTGSADAAEGAAAARERRPAQWTAMTGGPPATVRFDAASYLEVNATERGSALAVHDAGQDLTFAELWTAVRSFMTELRARGVRPGDVVAVCLPNVWRYVALEVAVPAIGAVLLPMPVRLGRREMDSTLQRSGAVLAIADGSSLLADAARALFVPFAHADDLVVDNAADGIAVPRPSDPDRIVQIAMTSGTTGLPKLASLSARLKQLTFEGFTSRLGIGPDDRMLPMSPITQGVGEMCLYALRTGAALVMTHEARFAPEPVLLLADRSRTTVLGGVPTMLGRLLSSIDDVRPDLHRLRATISAGAPLSPTLARQWEQRSDSRTCSFYGAMDIGQLSVPRPDDPAAKRWSTVGQPHDAAEWQISDPHGRSLPPGAEGEICMRGPLVQDRYWNDGGGPYAADGWAHFGDLGLIDDEGFLHVTGRLKDIIIRGGDNVNPLEVENLLREHPAVAEVAVVGRPDPDLGERTVAFVVPVPGGAPTLTTLTGFADDRGLARYKWPEQLYLLDVLPTASTGKLDRAALRARATEPTTTARTEGLV